MDNHQPARPVDREQRLVDGEQSSGGGRRRQTAFGEQGGFRQEGLINGDESTEKAGQDASEGTSMVGLSSVASNPSGDPSERQTHSGNFPRTRARYVFPTSPAWKSFWIALAVFPLSAKNMRPDVRRSSRLTAGDHRTGGGVSFRRAQAADGTKQARVRERGDVTLLTVDAVEAELWALEDLNARVLVVPPRRVHRRPSGLVDHDELPCRVDVDDLDRVGGHGGLVAMDDVSE